MFQAAIALSLLCVTAAFDPAPGWAVVNSGLALDNIRMNPVFVLPVANLGTLEDLVANVSNPAHAAYGKYWTATEVAQLTRPAFPTSTAAYTAALGWDCRFDIDVWACQNVSATELETHWDVGFLTFAQVNRTGRAGTRLVTRATRGPALPDAVAAEVVFVAGLGVTPPWKPLIKDDNNDSVVIPVTMRTMFNVPSGLQLTPNVSLAAVQFQDMSAFLDTDLQQQATAVGVPYCAPTVFVGPFDNSTAGDESALDAAVITGLACGATLWWQTVPTWLWDYAHGRAHATSFPDVSSISWGWWTGGQCTIDSAACGRMNATTSYVYVNRVEAELAKTALMGQTHVVASGDAGCHGRTDENCAFEACRAIYPGSSKYVTSVSATAIQYGSGTPVPSPVPPVCAGMQCAAGGKHGPCYLNAPNTGCFWTAGGGIAGAVTRPAYQAAAVGEYLKSANNLPPSNDYGTGRGYPDVSALGHNVVVVMNGGIGTADGTSASTPMVASFLTMVNQARVNAGQPKLGLANPWLYALAAKNPAAFGKVADGNNACTEETCCATGFFSGPAAGLWDPVTGLGTPNISALLLGY